MIVKAYKGLYKPTICMIIKNDTILQAWADKVCQHMGTTIQELATVPDKNLFKQMKIAIKYSINYTDTTDVNTLCSLESLGHDIDGSICEKINIQPDQRQQLLQLRLNLRFPADRENTLCPYCDRGEYHTNLHVLTKCTFTVTQRVREQQQLQLTIKPKI
jgi:ribosomal protein L37E